MTRRINFIGAGKLGRTLAKLWHDQGVFEIGDIVNRSLQSATNATTFIGAGQAVDQIASMQSANVYLLSVPDDVISDCAHQLLKTDVVKPGSVIFHCSGALPSTVLIPAQSSLEKSNLHIASVHPMRSFADPKNAANNFAGTYCAIEGYPKAVQILTNAFEKIGGKLFSVNAANKTLYHAACCITSNYLTVLMEFAVQCFEQSGVERDQALRIMQPLAQGTVDDIFSLGTTAALTGPIERGDVETIKRQLQAIKQWGDNPAELYKLLSEVTVELSQKKGSASDDSLTQLADTLKKFPQD